MNKTEQAFIEKLENQNKVPEIVENKAQAAFSKILQEKDQNTVTKPKFRPYRKAVGAAAGFTLLFTATIGTLAATGYFDKKVIQKDDQLTYDFSINYDLVPGEFSVKTGYLPKGFKEQETNKYWTDDNWGHGISILPIYSTNVLEECETVISQDDIDKIEKISLNGMEAHVITYKESDKYLCPTNIFLFNPQEGYVAQVYGDYSVPVEELKKVADDLTITRVGDAATETAQEKEVRLKDEASAKLIDQELQENLLAIFEQGMPQEKLFPLGTEGVVSTAGTTYTVNGYEYFDSIKEIDTAGFKNYDEVKPWLNEDGTLKPYTRQKYKYTNNGDTSELIEEKATEQTFLKVNISVKCKEAPFDNSVPLDATLLYTRALEDGRLTWGDGYVTETEYRSVPAENYNLQLDDRCIWISQAENLTGDERAHQFFWMDMENGEERTYDLIFVVDKDRVGQFVLDFNGYANSPDNLLGYHLLEENK